MSWSTKVGQLLTKAGQWSWSTKLGQILRKVGHGQQKWVKH